jgi:hypothetical protein
MRSHNKFLLIQSAIGCDSMSGFAGIPPKHQIRNRLGQTTWVSCYHALREAHLAALRTEQGEVPRVMRSLFSTGLAVSSSVQRERRGHGLVEVITYVFAPLSVELVQLFIKNTLFLELLVGLVKHQGRTRVLDRVMGIGLNVLAKNKPRKETERKATLTLS